MTPAGPRSLADDLRSRDDASLVDLLRARPDLAVPVPPDLASLALRATTRASVQRALDGLDAPTLQVVEVLAVLPEPAAPAAVSAGWGADATGVVELLRALALVWGPPGELHLVRSARDVLGPHPAGLGPPLAELLDRRGPGRVAELTAELGAVDRDGLVALLGDPAEVRRLLDLGPPTARAVLDRLRWGPPVGELGPGRAPAPPGSAAGDGPVTWLLRHGLLALAEPGRVVLPREVGLALRDGRVHPTPASSPPAVTGRDLPPATVDATAAGSAAEAVRLVAAAIEVTGRVRHAVLRAGGLGVRELRRLAAALDVAEPDAARVVEAAHAAGLLAEDGEAEPAWAPTPAADAWLDGTTAQRWGDLVVGWLVAVGVPALAGGRDASGVVRPALSEAVRRPSVVGLRRDLLALLLTLPVGRAPDVEAVLARLTHAAPRRSGPARDQLARWLLADADWLGVTGLGALAGPARALLGGAAPDGGSAPADGAPDHGGGSHREAPHGGARRGPELAPRLAPDPAALDRAVAALDDLLPAPVDHLILQADLTAVAPGPLVPRLAELVELAADTESRGHATVYRFTAGSVRRALDAGRTADELLDELTAASPGDVPQPLTYLVRDVARRHGQIRVGSAAAILRAEDPVALGELLADRRASGLGLRRLAPTVLAAAVSPAEVLTTLRDMGLAPAAEAGDGSLVVGGERPRRTPPRRRPRAGGPPALPSTAELAEAVARWRVTERGPRPGSVELPRLEPAASLAVLRDAVAAGRRVWVGYVDETGRATQRLLEPRTLSGGRLVAVEVGRAGTRSFAVHRVTGAALEPAG